LDFYELSLKDRVMEKGRFFSCRVYINMERLMFTAKFKLGFGEGIANPNGKPFPHP
jgi:hypothetical protein